MDLNRALVFTVSRVHLCYWPKVSKCVDSLPFSLLNGSKKKKKNPPERYSVLIA